MKNSDAKGNTCAIAEDGVGKVIPPAEQTATVTMGDRSNPTKLTFLKENDKLVSDKVAAEGISLPVVLQIKVTPDAKTISTKFNLNMSKCPTCSNPEYACACDHHEDDHGHKHGDDHKH